LLILRLYRVLGPPRHGPAKALLLNLVEPGKEAVPGQQFLRGAFLHKPPSLQHGNPVHPQYGPQAVGNTKSEKFGTPPSVTALVYKKLYVK
jgi:hypothetical protein